MFRLALLLGRTVAELERDMSSRELSEWIAYQRIHPLPDGYWQAGMIASVMANCWGATTTPDDFIPRVVREEDGGQDGDDALAIFSSFATAHNARFSPDG
jgi:hypothetical protein